MTLAIDTKLFIDPLCLAKSTHEIIRVDAETQYRSHFETVIKFLTKTKIKDDIAWRSARKMLTFHEIRGTCLGYGAGIDGSAFGANLTNRLLKVAKEVVDLGVTDPDLFLAMALFESDIGPDRISDMTTHIIREALAAFNEWALRELSLVGESFVMHDVEAQFLVNPFHRKRPPIILVPSDILRKLPIATDWDEVADAASKNEMLRARVNRHIGHIWQGSSKREKSRLRDQVLSSRDAFQTLLDAIHQVPKKAYDVTDDQDRLVRWAVIAKELVDRFPLKLIREASEACVYSVTKQIIDQFRHLIENRGLNKELFRDNGTPRHESTAQRLFFAVAHSYCKANDIDISPEIDTGNGKIDFKLSNGFSNRVVVEVKLSTNNKLVSGYTSQLDTYRTAEQTQRAVYLVIDVGRMGRKDVHLAEERNRVQKATQTASSLEFVDGRRKPSASKR
ncbi:MAG: hypothetical protein HZA46_20340 [Planctomycetales bacterium]|nr:hypothetical protein [Planctomycetales bacterium]